MKRIVSNPDTDYIYRANFSVLAQDLDNIVNRACRTIQTTTATMPLIPTIPGGSVSSSREPSRTRPSLPELPATAIHRRTQPSQPSRSTTLGLPITAVHPVTRRTVPSTRGLPITAIHLAPRRTEPSTSSLPPTSTLFQPPWTWTVSVSESFTTASQSSGSTRPRTPGLPRAPTLSISQSYPTDTKQSQTSWNPAQLPSSTATPSGSRSSDSTLRTGSTKSVAVTTTGFICVLLN